MLHVDDSLLEDKGFKKLTAKIDKLKNEKRNILKRSSKWVLAIFVEALLVQVLSIINVPISSFLPAMLVVIALFVYLCYRALKSSKGYKSAKKELVEAERDLGNYCRKADVFHQASSNNL